MAVVGSSCWSSTYVNVFLAVKQYFLWIVMSHRGCVTSLEQVPDDTPLCYLRLVRAIKYFIHVITLVETSDL